MSTRGQADPEHVRARLRPFHGRLRHEIERFGGTVEIGSLPDEAFARLRAAQRLLGGGQRATGGTQLQCALALFRQVGATAHLRQGAALVADSA